MIDPELDPTAPEDDDDDDDESDDSDETFEEPLSDSATDDDDDESGGIALAPPPPAPPGSEELSDQLRYAITVFEDAMFVSDFWADRARYGLGEAPVEWTEPT